MSDRKITHLEFPGPNVAEDLDETAHSYFGVLRCGQFVEVNASAEAQAQAQLAIDAGLVKSVTPPAAPGVPPPAPLPPAATELDVTPGGISTVNSEDALELVAKADTVDELAKLEAAEKASQRHAGGRKGVLNAIGERRQELAGRTLSSDESKE